MVPLETVFIGLVIFFGLVGMLRGWAKELLVTFSVILALFSLNVLETFVPFFKETIQNSQPETIFWIKAGVLGGLVFFGYQTPKIPKLAESGRFIRHMLKDTMLGLVLGAVNGYLVFGSLWYYLHALGYPFPFVIEPDAMTQTGQAALRWISLLPPTWLVVSPTIYIAVAVCFVFVLVMFI